MPAPDTIRPPRVALATCSSLPEIPVDELMLQVALRELGIDARIAAWDDVTADWSDLDAVIIRSTWNYHLRPEAFFAWIEQLDKAGVDVWNRPSLLRWNAHKRYLADLEARGIAVVPTRWISMDGEFDLRELFRETGWNEVVVKPAISASAHQTYRLGPDRCTLTPEELAAASGHDFLVQPFLEEVSSGELSLIFIDGDFSHAVIKFPQAGDFRVQRHCGGREERFVPPVPFIDEARQVLAAAGEIPLYARVDAVVRGGRLLVMELELIEPSLFLTLSDGGAGRLAEAIMRRLRPRHLEAVGPSLQRLQQQEPGLR
ncbi:MAG TPA: hypothetical protein VM346_02090 [Sphingomicrobium sp.]|nr:hypothetical protein [Sphingomicrobium sp.]